jgi:hypothetical protein
MNKAELLADLATKAVVVYDVQPQQDTVKAAAGITVYAAQVMELDGVDKLQGRTIAFYVLGEGTAQEQAFYKDTVQLPKDKNELGLNYMASKVMDGTIASFEMQHSRPDLGPFSFFDVEVVLPGGGAFEGTKKMWRVQQTGESAFHITLL